MDFMKAGIKSVNYKGVKYIGLNKIDRGKKYNLL